MNIIELSSLIVAIATFVASLIAAVIAWKNATGIQNVHLSINSRMDELLRATGIAARASGVESERLRAELEKQTLRPPNATDRDKE